MTTVGLLGDVHGNRAWTVYALMRLHGEGVTEVFQLGDFGFGLADDGFIRAVDAYLRSHGMVLFITPGNHDDYDFIEGLTVKEDGLQHVTDNILVMPRGFRMVRDDRTIVSLGGAPSVDRTYRLNQEKKLQESGHHRKLWWVQEQITQADVKRVTADGVADIMLAHDAPYTETIERNIKGNPHGFPPLDILYAEDGRKLMDEAARAVKPLLFLHGHYHFPVYDKKKWDDGRSGWIVGLDADQSAQSFATLDLDTLIVAVLPNQQSEFLLHLGWSQTEVEALLGKA